MRNLQKSRKCGGANEWRDCTARPPEQASRPPSTGDEDVTRARQRQAVSGPVWRQASRDEVVELAASIVLQQRQIVADRRTAGGGPGHERRAGRDGNRQALDAHADVT